MKLPISPGLWLVYVGAVYLVVGFANIHYKWFDTEYASLAYVIVLSLPLCITPLAQWVGVKTLWDTIRDRK